MISYIAVESKYGTHNSSKHTHKRFYVARLNRLFCVAAFGDASANPRSYLDFTTAKLKEKIFHNTRGYPGFIYKVCSY